MFLLDKWYLDLVTAGGGVFMGYSAALRWHGLGIGYESSYSSPPDGPPVERTALSQRHPPDHTKDVVSWCNPTLGLAGTWYGVAPRLRRRLHRDDRGSVLWLCHQPRSRARVHLPDDRVLDGVGYVERLRMTVPPTDLDIDVLHWGRFHGDGETLVWIAWRRGAAGRWIFRNGALQLHARVDGDGVFDLDDGATLHFAGLRPLRDRRLLPVLASIPGLPQRGRLGRLANVHETKWIGRGVLKRRSGGESHGQLIHEEVTWLGAPPSQAACSTARSS